MKGLTRWIAAAAMVAALGTSCSSKGGPSGGPRGGAPSAEQAVSGVLSALSLGRYDQAANFLAPGERAALYSPVNDTFTQLIRLGLLAPGTSLSHIPGIGVSFTGATYKVTTVRAGLDYVTFTGGTVTGNETPSALPVGPKLAPLVASMLSRAKPQTKTHPLTGGTNNGIATVEVNGRWYVSLGYSIAESARRNRGAAVPTTTITPAGDSSADAAVRDLLNAATQLDVTRLLALTPPDEDAAARDYSSMFLPKANQAVTKLSKPTIHIDNLTLGDESRTDGTLVHIKTIKLTGTYRGTQFTYQNGCFSVDTGVTIQFCKKDLSRLLANAHLPAPMMDLVTVLAGLRPDTGIVAVDEGGKWYVSPTRTLIDDFNGMLASVSPAQVDQIISDIRQLVHSNPFGHVPAL